MITIPGYDKLSKIYDSSRSIIFRARAESADQPVILKILKEDFPAAEEILRYRHEYEITRNLKHLSGVVEVHAVKKILNTLVITMEDFGASSLKDLRSAGKIMSGDGKVKAFLEIAIRVVEILGEIHQENIIHKDISPSNIVMNPKTGQIKIIDFGISTELSRENPVVKNPGGLEGTLAYISPEQTGRMNRSLDYRTDFYSLGATFYELLTRELPFETDDPMELVHCHIARQPVPPHERLKEIPKPVSDIVMKLMAKNAEERYHGAWGVKWDLEQCLNALNVYKEISPFPIGARDVPVRFHLPQKLYGRERDIETLMDAFERVCRGKAEVTLITGDSGIGKTVLVREMYKPVTRRRGYFISGKFDQVHVRPYGALIQAFQELVGQLLTEGETPLGKWRDQLLTALGPNGRLIVDVIPELELIIGEQPRPPRLSLEEGRNRFNLVFKKFIGVFARRGRPLVIFLDDLQWTDGSTLALLELLSADQGAYLLLIGAYRENEVQLAHPLMLTLDELREAGVDVNHISLTPLEAAHIIRLISDALKVGPEKAASLAELVLNKTNGNPFFINEFLKSLYVEKLLEFDFREGDWRWDLDRIHARDITDNVVHLMSDRLQMLAEKTRRVLRLAACMDAGFDLETLAIVYEHSQKETAACLREAVEEGLVLETRNLKPDADAMDIEIQNPDFQLRVSSFQYKFSHDQIRQAAYSMISDSERRAAHLRVGRLLLQNTPPENRDRRIFDIVNHLNLGWELIESRSELDELAALNLIAGKRARASAANDQAFRYLKTGIGLLEEENWKNQYDLTLSLYVEATEAACLIGEFEEMDRLARVVLKHAGSLLDRMKVYEARILACSARNMPLDAVKIGLRALALLGVKLPEKPGKPAILRQLVQVRLALAFRRIEDIVELPEMTDPEDLAAMHVIITMISAVYLSNPELFLMVISVGVVSCLKKGAASSSPIFFAGYGLVLCGAMGYVDAGFRFGLLSLDLLKRFNADDQKCRVIFIFNFFIRPWKEHIRDSLKPMVEAYRIGLETGDLVYSGHSSSMYCLYSFLVGRRLAALEREIASYCQAIRRLKQERAVNLSEQYRQVISNLLGRSDDPCLLIGDCYDERVMLGVHEKANDGSSIFCFYLNKTMLCHLFGRYDQALENADMTETYLEHMIGLIYVPLFHFYDSLARIAVCESANESEQKRLLKKISRNQRKMKKWARFAPMNFLHKYCLVEAERLRIDGKDIKAAGMYDRAISLAKEHSYIQEEALANELAGEFYLSREKISIGRVYLEQARYGYLRWGAAAKVDALDEKHAELSIRARDASGDDSLVVRTTTGVGGSEKLDLNTVMKSSRVISSEIVLEKLLKNLMKTLIENAGAQKGFLILETNFTRCIEAGGSVDSEKCDVLRSIPVEKSRSVSPEIINYVARTSENVVLRDAFQEGEFKHCPYIIRNRPRSILCMPLVNQGRLIAILYLENNSVAGAFTKDRLETLNLLSAQAAISIENSRLYMDMSRLNKTLERKVEERTDDLNQKNVKLKQVNERLEHTLDELKQSQAQLIQSEKMAALGQLIAGIAHEINTPLGVIRGSCGNISKSLEKTLDRLPELLRTLSGETLDSFFALLKGAIGSREKLTTREARKKRRALTPRLKESQVDSPRNLADTLVDMGVYEDVEPFLPLLKEPGALGIIQAAQQLSGLEKNSRNISTAVERASKIVFALKKFSHQDHTGEKIVADIVEGLEMVLTLYYNQIKHGMEIVKKYREIPKVPCYPDELNQIWTNLIHNALQAMEHKGRIEIETAARDDFVEVSFTDNGPGIPKEIQERVFQPFFTTRAAGEGSGLGLDICRKIIEKHQGEIQFDSRPGQTTFRVRIPLAAQK